MAMAPQTLDDPVAAGNDALDRGAWEEARGHFEAALRREESAEAWDGAGWAGWWLSDAELTLRARERAYRAYRARGDLAAAGRVAAWLAADFREFRGEAAVGRGWLERAHRLLDDLPQSADHGWLALIEGDFALNVDGRLEDVQRLSRLAVRLGRVHGVPDLEVVGLAQEGIAMVMSGQVEAGMRRLDEASAFAGGEELELPVSLGWALCCLISACDGVGDFPRAAQWCKAMRRFAERWGGRQLLGVCRTAYGRVLATSGDWAAAETELTAAVKDLVSSRPGMSAGGLVRLGELRARQGRTEEARELYERAGPRGLLGLGELALDAGDAAAAVDMAERVLRRLPADTVLERLPGLELLVRGRARLGQFESAERAADDVERTVTQLGTPYLRGRARLVRGELDLARGLHDEARRACEDAVDSFDEGAAPYDAAVARLALARTLAALGREQHAAAEALAARRTFEALGAARDVARADAPLVAGGGAGGSGSLGELTPREVEVLTLVAQGLSDAEIAERLVVSPHTVHRHVANVRAKLRLPSRAAAVAYAARAGML
jgi:ATP/maltotriose-dependent transcriptional regulator MalT